MSYCLKIRCTLSVLQQLEWQRILFTYKNTTLHKTVLIIDDDFDLDVWDITCSSSSNLIKVSRSFLFLVLVSFSKQSIANEPNYISRLIHLKSEFLTSREMDFGPLCFRICFSLCVIFPNTVGVVTWGNFSALFIAVFKINHGCYVQCN